MKKALAIRIPSADVQDVRLDYPCTPCQGQGFVESPRWREYEEQREALFGVMTAAPDWWVDENEPTSMMDECEACGGVGMVPTPAGEEVLAFLYRYKKGWL